MKALKNISRNKIKKLEPW